jgi:cytochrome P450
MQALRQSMVVTTLGTVLTKLNCAWMEKYLSRAAARTRSLLNQAVDAVIARNASSDSNKSLLQSLLQATSVAAAATVNSKVSTSSTLPIPRLTQAELRDEVKTFIIAGHETTSTWCYWALYALAKHRDVHEKVYQDICQHVPSSSSSSMLTSDQVAQMDFVVAFLYEVLRLYAPVGVITRVTTRSEQWHGHCMVPAHTRLLIPIHLLHRHADYWTRPDDFIPKRWLDRDECAARHRFCFLPFSAGGRNCIGQRFAEMEATVIVANIVRAFDIQLAPSMKDADMSLTNFLTTKAKDPIVIRIASRAH